jgi:FtsH-binding integral membrane protein
MCLHFEFALRHILAEGRDAAPPSLPPEQETTVDWNKFIRRTHRWLSIAFTLTVIANFAAMTQGPPPAWITYSPLPPLFLLLFSGLYMFFLPHLSRAPATSSPTGA